MGQPRCVREERRDERDAAGRSRATRKDRTMVESKRARAAGGWRSPIRAETVAAAGLRLSEPRLSADAVHWLEGRPSEGGRVVPMLARFDALDRPEELAPSLPALSARSRVNEYGGGAYWVSPEAPAEAALIVDHATQQIVDLRGEALTPPGASRGDLRLSPDGRWLVCIRGDRGRGRRGRAPLRRRLCAGSRSRAARGCGGPPGRRGGARLLRESALRRERTPPRLRHLGSSGDAVGRDRTVGARLGRRDGAGRRGAQARCESESDAESDGECESEPGRDRGGDRPARVLTRRIAGRRHRPQRVVESCALRGLGVQAALRRRGRVRRADVGARSFPLRLRR